MSGNRVLALVLLGGVMLIDGYDLNAMALAVPWLAPELGLEPTAFGIVHSAVLLGLGAGALLVAPLGDRIGRKPVIVGGCLAIAVATFATGLSASITAFAIWRLLTGIALGACLANVSALSAEMAPEGKRSTMMALVSAGISIGALIAGFTAPELVDLGGWRMLFFLPGVIALTLAIGLALVLPRDERVSQAPSAARAKVPLVELLRPPLLFPLAVFAGAYTLNAVALYMLISWTPVVLPQAGFPVDLAARVQGLLQGCGLVVGIGLAVLLDRWKPGAALALGYAVIAAAFVAIWATPPAPVLWSVLLLVAGGGVSGIHAALMALTPKLFPSRVLSSAIGTGVAVSRIGAVAAPLIGGALIAGGIAPAAYFLTLVVPVAICAALVLLVPRAMRASEAEPVRA